MQNWQVSPPSSARRLVLASPMIACISDTSPSAEQTHPRATLVQRALVAKRYSPCLCDFYGRIKSRRDTGKINTAVAGKFPNTIFYKLKNDWVFEDFSNFVLSLAINHRRIVTSWRHTYPSALPLSLIA